MRQGGRVATRISAVAWALTALGAFTAGCGLDANGAFDGPSDASANVLDTGADVSSGRDVTPGQLDATTDTSADVVDAGAPDVASDGFDACAPLETDCLNGVDDDCNGHTDCDDPACLVGYTCAPIPGSPWSGYSLYDDDRSAACPTGYPAQSDAYEGLIALPATCAACACGAASGATCSPAVTVYCASTPVCTAGGSAVEVRNQCTGLAPLTVATIDSCEATRPSVAGGSCPPSGGGPTRPTPSFSKLSRVCGTARAGGGCGAAGVCLPKPAGTSHGVCVAQPLSGAALCPTPYPHAHVVSLDGKVTDGRGCTACTCGGASGASCTGSVTLHAATGCTDPTGGLFDDAGVALGTDPVTLAGDGTCHTGVVKATETFLSGILTTSVAAQGSCVPGVATATGAASPTAQSQYCCQN